MNNDKIRDVRDANSALVGCQFGVGIQAGRKYWPKADFSDFVEVNFVGDVMLQQTTVSGSQKNGITIDGLGSAADISDSTVIGFGPNAIIGQNGIQIGRGAQANVRGSSINSHSYTGTFPASSTGILVFGGCGDALTTRVTLDHNSLSGNDVGIYLDNESDVFDPSVGYCPTPPATKTGVNVRNNTLSNAAVTNAGGNGDGRGYQAGVFNTPPNAAHPYRIKYSRSLLHVLQSAPSVLGTNTLAGQRYLAS